MTYLSPNICACGSPRERAKRRKADAWTRAYQAGERSMFSVAAKIGGGYEVRNDGRTIRVFVGPTAHEDAWQLRDQLAHAEIDRRELHSDPTQPDPELMDAEGERRTAEWKAWMERMLS